MAIKLAALAALIAIAACEREGQCPPRFYSKGNNQCLPLGDDPVPYPDAGVDAGADAPSD